MSQFLTEVRAQPEALRALVAHYRSGEGIEALEALRALRGAQGAAVLFTGMGSSFHAPGLVRARLSAAGIRTQVAEAGELLHYGMEAVAPGTVVVALSQSGESAETLQVAENLAAAHPVVAVTNDPRSALARCAQVVLPLCAGAETAISTKTYTNTLALLHLLAAAVAAPTQETAPALEGEVERLEDVAGTMDEVLTQRAEEAAAAAGFLEGAAFLYFVARGPALVAAQQAALTFTEGARLPTCALSGGAFRHGPLELAGPGFAGVFLAPTGATRHLIEGVAGEVAGAGGRVVVMTQDDPTGAAGPGGAGAHDYAHDAMRLAMPDVGEDLFPLVACVPLELLLYRVARERGLEAGVFERITKITRRE